MLFQSFWFSTCNFRSRLPALLCSICLFSLIPLRADQLSPSAASDGSLASLSPSAGAETGLLDLSIEQSVQEGLSHNLDLMAAKFNIPIAEADELTAGLMSNPSFMVDTIFEPFGSNWDQSSAGGPRQFDAGFAFPVDLSGKRGAARKSAHATTQITQAEFMDAVRQEVLQIRQMYVAVVTSQHQVELAKEKTENYDRLVEIIENRVGFKRVQPLLLMRAQLARDQSHMDLTQMEDALRSAKTQLAIQLGRQPDEAAFHAVTELRSFEMASKPDPNELLAMAVANRPDLKALELARDKAKLDYELAEDEMWDDSTVTLEMSSQGPEDANPNQAASASVPQAYSWDAALNLPFPLFNLEQGDKKKARISGDQAEKQIESLKLNIQQQLGDELAQLAIDQDLIKQYEATQINNARRVRDEQQKLFGTGNMDLLDYFDAMEAYNGVLSSYYATVGSYRNDLAQIDATVGKEMNP
jgi:cobalt-zinc-cadmium efflux system outer membrane protein